MGGRPASTFYAWMAKGERKLRPFRESWEKVNKAKAEARTSAEARISRCCPERGIAVAGLRTIYTPFGAWASMVLYPGNPFALCYANLIGLLIASHYCGWAGLVS